MSQLVEIIGISSVWKNKEIFISLDIPRLDSIPSFVRHLIKLDYINRSKAKRHLGNLGSNNDGDPLTQNIWGWIKTLLWMEDMLHQLATIGNYETL